MLNRRVRKILDWGAGLTLIALGALAGIVPFVPGWVLVLGGLAVLSSHSRWAHAIHTRMQRFVRGLGDKLAARRNRT